MTTSPDLLTSVDRSVPAITMMIVAPARNAAPSASAGALWPLVSQCYDCTHVRIDNGDGSYTCVEDCNPFSLITMYLDPLTGTCQPCDPSCSSNMVAEDRVPRTASSVGTTREATQMRRSSIHYLVISVWPVARTTITMLTLLVGDVSHAMPAVLLAAQGHRNSTAPPATLPPTPT